MRARTELAASLRSVVALAVILGVAGGVVLFSAAGARRTDTAYPRLLTWAHTPDTVVAGGGLFGFSRIDLARVARLPQVASSARISRFFFYPTTRSGRLLAVGVGAGSAAASARDLARMGRVKVLHGRRADPTRADEVEVGFASEDFTHVRAGTHLVLHFWRPGVDFLRYYGGETPVPFDKVPPRAFAFSVPVTVTGITVTPGDFPQQGPFGDVMFTPAFARRYVGRLSSQPSLDVHLRPGTDVRAFQRDVATVSSGGNPQIASILDTVPAMQRSIHPQAIAMWMFAALAALAGVLAFAQALARQTFLDSSENATLRSLGMTARQLFAVSMLRAALVGILGALGAIVLCILLSPLMPLGHTKVAEPHPGFSVDWTVIGLGALGIAAASIVAGAVPAWRAARAQAGARGANVMAERTRPSTGVGLAARAGLPPSAVAGVRMALEPGRGRTATPVRSALVGTTFAIAALVAAFGFAASFEHLFRTPRLSGVNWDVALGVPFTGDLSPRVVPVLRSNPDVAGFASANDSASIELVSESGRRATAGVLAVERVRGDVHPTLVSGTWPRSPGEIALGNNTLRTLHASIGQRVEAIASTGRVSMRVVGTAAFINASGTTTSPGDGAGVTYEGLTRILPNAPRNIFLVDLSPRLSMERKRAAVGRIQRETHIQVLPGSGVSGLDDLEPVRKLPLVLAALLALAAAATVAHSLLTSIRRRRRDLAILKTLGFVRRQVSAAVAWQATTLAALALLVGLPLGVAAGRWAWTLFAGRLGVAAEPVVGLVAVLLAIPATAAVANLLAAAPGRIAARTEPARVLRSE